MAYLEVKNVCIKGISACVPKTCDDIFDIYKWGDATDFINTTGITHRRRADDATTSSDLCLKAAEKLIQELSWDKNEIECLIFVTQTPDFILPATSPILQHELGISKDCYTLDISLGCSGWVYALSVITSLMQSGFIKKGLLLAGETPTKICSPDDKSTYPLFGDAGTATALEFSNGSPGFYFIFNSDGKGADVIKINDGGYRNPFTLDSLEEKEFSPGIKRKDTDVKLEGMDVFSFGISKAPKSVNNLLEKFNIDKESVDLFTFHQANMMMNEMIRKKLKLDSDKVPYSLSDFANTSCASIPLTLVTQEANRLRNNQINHIACGFGVGLSWSSVYFETDKIVVPDLIEI